MTTTLAFLILVGTPAAAASLATESSVCSNIANRLHAVETTPSELFWQWNQYKDVVVSLRKQADCKPALLEKALWSHADALDRYAASVKDGRRMKFHMDAIGAYSAYLRWFTGLDTRVRERLIGSLLGEEGSVARATSASSRDDWLRRRPGGALYALTQAAERIGKVGLMLDSLSAIVPGNEFLVSDRLLKDWYSHLRTQPSLVARDMADRTIHVIASRCPECRDRWREFLTALEAATTAPSKWRTETRTKVAGWLQQSNT